MHGRRSELIAIVRRPAHSADHHVNRVLYIYMDAPMEHRVNKCVRFVLGIWPRNNSNSTIQISKAIQLGIILAEEPNKA